MTSSLWKVKGLTWADIIAGYVMWFLVIFLIDEWGLNFTLASAIVNVFSGLIAIAPLILAHIPVGDYKMVLLTSFAHILGFALLAISAKGTTCKYDDYGQEQCNISTMRVFLFVMAILLIIIGASRYRLTWFNDLIDETESQLSKLMRGLKILVTIVVHLVGALAIPRINQWSLKFGIPGMCTFVATIIFLTGNFSSWHASFRTGETEEQSSIITVFRVLVASAYGRFNNSLTGPSNMNVRENNIIVRRRRLRCLDRATQNLPNQNLEVERNRWKHCTVEEVEETKKAIYGMPFCIAFFVLGIISSVGDTYFVEQADTMDRMVGNWEVPSVVLVLFYELAKKAFAKSYLKIKVKFYGKVSSKYAGFHGILVSTVLATICCATAAIVEVRRLNVVRGYNFSFTRLVYKIEIVPLSMFWLVPQYVLLGGLDGMAEESIDLFFSDPAPASSDRIMNHVAYCFFGLGNIGSILSVDIVRKVSAWRDGTSWFVENLNESRFDKYCWVLTGQSAANFIFCMILFYLTDLRSEETEPHHEMITTEPQTLTPEVKESNIHEITAEPPTLRIEERESSHEITTEPQTLRSEEGESNQKVITTEARSLRSEVRDSNLDNLEFTMEARSLKSEVRERDANDVTITKEPRSLISEVRESNHDIAIKPQSSRSEVKDSNDLTVTWKPRS